jgi:pimeloyl-ACP methyl ester carboxylesterase
MRLVYIHGATASERSFAFIQESLKSKNPIYLNYDKESQAKDNIEKMIKELALIDGPFFIICHSLGGIYATYMQKAFPNDIKGVVSMATPFNGSDIATWGSIFNPGYTLFGDITPHSEFIRYSRSIPITVPWTQIVTTEGNVPWLRGENDGIVTRASMTCRDDVKYIEIPRNHYEVVLSKRAVAAIEKLIKK